MSPGKRYPSDLTNCQRRSRSRCCPAIRRAPGGRPPRHAKREIVNAIVYQLRSVGRGGRLPEDLPRKQVYGYFREQLRTQRQAATSRRRRRWIPNRSRAPTPSVGVRTDRTRAR
jgi:putative transposase